MDLVEIKQMMMICSLAACSEDEARAAYEKTGDVLLAVDSILFPDQELPKPLKRKREDITPEEEHLTEVRQIMKNFDAEIENRPQQSISDLPVCMEEDETPDPLEETALQSSCFQQCQIPSMEGVDQTQETEYH